MSLRKFIDIIATELDADPALMGIDIRGLESSFDGSQIIFSVRAIPDIENNNEPELFTWNLWTYDLETEIASYVIPSALIRNEGADTGSGHDLEPHFLTMTALFSPRHANQLFRKNNWMKAVGSVFHQ